MSLLLYGKIVSMTTLYLLSLSLFSPVHSTLKSTFSSLVAERDRLRHTIDLQGPQPAQVMGLKTTYASVSASVILRDYTTHILSIYHHPVSLNWPLLLIRNVKAAPPWSTRCPMRAKRLFQSRYQSFSMLRSTSSPLLPLRWDTMCYLIFLLVH